MSLKTGVTLIFLLIPVLAFTQNRSAEFRVYENGEEVVIPDSLDAELAKNSTQIEQKLLRWFVSEGLFDAAVTSTTDSTAQVTKGCKYRLDKMNVLYSGQIDSSSTIEPDKFYTDQNLRAEIAELIYGMEEDGFPFAEAIIKSITPIKEECLVDVEIEILTGDKVTRPDIYFSGARTNSQDYLRKISRFNSNRQVSPDYLRILRSNLNSSGLFNVVEPARIYLRQGEPVIVFSVEERSLNQFDGLLGYVPDAAGNGQIAGDVELSLWNVLTQGNGIDFRYQRLRPETSQLNLKASQDWIGEIPVGISAGMQLYQNDTTYQSRDVDLDGYYLVGSGVKLIGGVGFQSTTSGSNLPQVVEPDGQKRTARLGFEFTNVDRFDVPTKGSSIRLILGIANKDLSDDSLTSFTQNSLEFTARNYVPVFDKSVIATSLHGFLLESDKVTTNDLIRFGGANSFRGYAEQQFRAGTMLWGDVEYRFLLNRRSFLFGFAAAGVFERPKLLTETDNTFQITKYLFSTGFGLSYQTQIGRLKFTYAISPEESIGNGKVHFGIRTEL
ncbi:MAG: BamA/TamA family outer membrane protein [Gracilimonas sp.]|uniref:BamA/TamA family outer membrane protein n=1 Tax=Gracilimonas TaxID=649462 RepID=UPI001B14A9D1|nr:BamA/TamA family outer membrane protein [Gracilimonas sp.]MBO6586313.1 BamA/TamA family outer membrane protein [Gracilimonas sp.]MBO6614970.1 BamA/TamA family outer membrane protein [Gracilimonas sp.]